MALSQKCQYAVRAMFELARHEEGQLVTLRDISERQHIPARLLENVMAELRQGGFVKAKRGKDGGFTLGRSAGEISVGEIVRYMESSLMPVACVSGHACPLQGQCVFLDLWDEAKEAMVAVLDRRKLLDLVAEENRRLACEREVPDDVRPKPERWMSNRDELA